MFAIDEAHAGVVSWISARNALLCALFSFAALLSQIEARATRRRWLQALSVLCVALALASGESGVWALALLVAYALSFEPNGPAARPVTIWPQLAVGAAWVAVYLSGGYGVHGSSLYRELSQPLSVLLQGIADLPLWVTSSFGPSVVTIFAAFPASTGRLVTLPLALLLLWLLWPALARSPQCRFFALSAALGVAPLLATVPQDRLTLGIGFGTFGWLACFLAETQQRWARRALLALHAVLPLALFPLLLGSSGVQLEKGTQALLPLQAGAGQVVLVNSPVEILTGYVRTLDTRPRSFHTLHAGGGDLLLTRVAPDALEVSVPRGWGHTPIERVFGTARDLPHTGEVRDVREMHVEVLESTGDQHPRRVRFTFPTPLESPDRTWLRWEGQRPVRFTPPPLGAELRIAGQNTLAALPR